MNRAFLYGDGFFESIRIVENQIPLAQFHVSRIYDAFEILQLEPEFEVNEDFIYSCASNNNCTNGIMRISFYRDGGGKYLPDINGVLFQVNSSNTSKDFFLPTELDLEASLVTCPSSVGSIALYPEFKPMNLIYRIKTISALYYVMAAMYKKTLSSDYLLLQNEKQEICEELSSNLLLYKESEFFIPSLESGGVLGVTLRYLLATYGFQINEKNIMYKDLHQYEAIYSCKASVGLERIK